MIDVFLRAGNAGALASACPFLRGEDDGGERFWISTGEGFVLDVIGPLVIHPAVFDEDGNEVEPAVVDGRFHANLRCTDPAIVAAVPETVRVYPASPSRVWA